MKYFAFRVLHWSPAQFWAASPREILGAMQKLQPLHTMQPSELMQLMQQFPDEKQ